MRFFFAPFGICAAALAASALFSPRPSWAQPIVPAPPVASAPQNTRPMVHLAPADTQTFADALRSVSKQAGGVAFVAEGKPYRARNSTPPLAPVVKKWPAAGLPLDEAVQKIAGAYDYEAQRKGDVFLLRKRYTNPDDLPDVTEGELRLALRDASRAASGLPVPTVPPYTIGEAKTAFGWTFYQTLTPAQQEKLTNPSQFLYVSELNPAQQQMMRECVYSRHIQNAVDGVQAAFAAVQACGQKSTMFHWTDNKEQKVRVLGCDVRQGWRNRFSPFAPSGRVRFRFGTENVIQYGKKDPLPPDDAAPLPSDYGPNHAPLPPPVEAGPNLFTLQTLAEGLNNKAAGGGSAVRFAPDSVLATKSVLVVGGGNEQGDEALWRATGDVYGLRAVRTETNGPLRLLRPRAQIASNLADLNAAVLASLPDPLLRLQKGAIKTAEAKGTVLLPPLGDQPSALDKEAQAARVQAFSRARAPETIRTDIFPFAGFAGTAFCSKFRRPHFLQRHEQDGT